MSDRILEVMDGGKIPIKIGSVAEVKLQEKLGEGAFGSAWKVFDTVTGKAYVLKIIQGIAPGGVDAERVRLEASVSVPSEHIVEVLGLCEWDSSTYLILFKYYPGKSLDKLLEEGSLTSSQKKEIFKQALFGVADAHLCNIIHRDLKPANILVEDSGNVRIIDFGISKFKGKGLTVTGAIMGTLPYMAYELLVDGAKVADARSDIYALGQILYELAMGQNFWTRQGWKELKHFVAYLSTDPPPSEVMNLGDFHCDFYPDIADMLLRMAKINQEERPSSAEDVLAELGYIRGLPEPPPDLNLRYPMLIVESGNNRGSRTLVNIEDGGKLVIGRSDISGANASISRSHVEFSRSGDRYFVRDLESKNKTMVRGLLLDPKAKPTEIKHADRIRVGDIFLRFAFLRKI